MKIDIYRDFPIAGSGADVVLLLTLVSNFTRFQLYQITLTKLHVISKKSKIACGRYR